VSTYRPEFVAALSLLAEAFDEVVAAGYDRPIIVGGAAVEFYTGGAVASGDFDVLTAAQVELEAALQRKGFRRPNSPGMLTRGLYHPELGIGFEVVSGQLFDGAGDRTRTRIVSVPTGAVRFPAVEDMIADRMGQFAAPDRGDMVMLGQAVVLYRIARANLADPLDETYLDARIRHETGGSRDLQFLTEKADEADNP
jgi:hypothetical protein